MTGIEAIVGIVSALGAVHTGLTASAEADFQSQVAQQQADRERQIAALDAQNFERAESQSQALDRARRAGSGVRVSTGTPLLVDRATSTEAVLGRETIKAGGQTKASRLEQESKLFGLQSSNALASGGFNAASTFGKTLLTSPRSSFF